VKIGEKASHSFEVVRWVNKRLGAASMGLEVGSRFQDAGGGGAHGDDAVGG